MAHKLNFLGIKGFKSIAEFAFYPRQINVFIGPNGAGKSNFITFFTFLSYLVNEQLSKRIPQLGGSSDILHDGPDKTPLLSAELSIETEKGFNDYRFQLMFTKPDGLAFAQEEYRFSNKKSSSPERWRSCGVGHLEAQLPSIDNQTAKVIKGLLQKLIVYQFHNTSDTASIRLSWSTDDGRWLKSNAQNLGSFLFRLKREDPPYYRRIKDYIRLILPFFDDFELYDSFGKTLLRWKEINSEKVFNAGQASDGMLRAIALTALLAQNPKDLPAVLFLDEPELGLHPSAIKLIGQLIHTASIDTQVFLATQSVTLLNQFNIDDVVVIERNNRASKFKTFTASDQEDLQAYLEEYTLGEMWERNIIGGKPL